MNYVLLKTRFLQVWKWFRYLIAIIPFCWIFFKIDFHQMLHAAKSVAVWTIPLYTIVVLLSMSLQGVRWWALARVLLPSLSFVKAMNCHFAGLFYSTMLPGNAAQDFVRALLISKDNDYSVIWGATWLARILGLFVLAILSVYGLIIIDKTTIPQGLLLSVISAFSVLSILFFLSFSKKLTYRIRIILQKIVSVKILGIIEKIRESIYKYKKHPIDILVVSGITLVMQVLLVSAACFAIWGITGKLLIIECLTYIPLIELLCVAVPLTPNGLGIRESLLGIMFLHVGLSTEQLGVYILFGFYSILLKLFGGISVLFGFSTKNSKIKANER